MKIPLSSLLFHFFNTFLALILLFLMAFLISATSNDLEIKSKSFFPDAPHIDRRPELTKMAFARGAPANLICRASGYPAVEFTWFMQRGSSQKMEKVGMRHRDRGEFVMEAEQVNAPEYLSTTYESILEIDNIRTEHYTTLFRCEAANKYGIASHDIWVVKPGPPATPKKLDVTAIDDTSINLAWIPGFNGGYNQSFDIQVFDEDTGHRVLKLKNIRRVEGNKTTIMGLLPQTRYALKIRAWNRDGYSNFSDEIIIKTRRKFYFKRFFSHMAYFYAWHGIRKGSKGNLCINMPKKSLKMTQIRIITDS